MERKLSPLRLGLCAVALAFGVCLSANATVTPIDFTQLLPDTSEYATSIPVTTYENPAGTMNLTAGLTTTSAQTASLSGFTFSNFGVVGSTWASTQITGGSNTYVGSGYVNGFNGGSYAIFDTGEGPSIIAAPTGYVFTLSSLTVNAAWDKNLVVTILYQDSSGNTLYTQTDPNLLSVGSVQTISTGFDSDAVSQIEISAAYNTSMSDSSGGLAFNNPQIIVDGFSFTLTPMAPVPEPATAIFGVALLAAIGLKMSRRKLTAS